MKRKFRERYIIIALFLTTLLFFSVANEQSRHTEQLWKSTQPEVVLDSGIEEMPSRITEFSGEESPLLLNY